MSSSKSNEGGFKPSPPDFELVITSKKHTKHKTFAGFAFRNTAGGYALRLRPGITINWDDEVFLTLWPGGKKRGTAYEEAAQNGLGPTEPGPETLMEPPDDFPF